MYAVQNNNIVVHQEKNYFGGQQVNLNIFITYT